MKPLVKCLPWLKVHDCKWRIQLPGHHLWFQMNICIAKWLLNPSDGVGVIWMDWIEWLRYDAINVKIFEMQPPGIVFIKSYSIGSMF